MKEYNKIARGRTNEMWGVTTKTEVGQIDRKKIILSFKLLTG